MPAAILPAVAGFAVSGMASAGMLGATMATIAGTALGSTLVGAVTGAVVGGITAAVTDGDIMEGVLFGAVGGAVGGALGGTFGGELFGSLGATELSGAGMTTEGIEAAGFATQAIPEGVVATATTAGEAASSTGLLAGMSTTDKLLMAQSGMGLLEGFGGPEEPSLEDKMALQEQQHGFSMEQLEKQGDIRKEEFQMQLDEAAAERQRQRETASGLTLARKKSEGQASEEPTSLLDNVAQTPEYTDVTKIG